MTDTPVGIPVQRPSRSLIPGVLLIGFGLFFLAVNFLQINLETVWPVILLVPAIVFVIMVARDRNAYGLMMPATILLVYALLFFTCEVSGWDILERLWPVFILAPGLGFFMLYLTGRREAGLLVPATILTGISLVFLLVNFGYGYLWPAVLILAGVLLLVRRKPAAPPAPPAIDAGAPLTLHTDDRTHGSTQTLPNDQAPR